MSERLITRRIGLFPAFLLNMTDDACLWEVLGGRRKVTGLAYSRLRCEFPFEHRSMPVELSLQIEIERTFYILALLFVLSAMFSLRVTKCSGIALVDLFDLPETFATFGSEHPSLKLKNPCCALVGERAQASPPLQSASIKNYF